MLVSLLPTTIFAEEEDEEAATDATEITEAEPEEETSDSLDVVIGEGGNVSLVTEDEEADTEEDAGEAEPEEEAEEEPEEDAEDIVYQAESGSVRVEVTAPADALPEDAKLSVERYAKDSANYRDAAEAIDLEEGSDMAALDISFLVEGEEVEPSEPVKVSIDVSDILPEDADASTLEVQHLVETPNDTIKPVVVANESSATDGTIDENKATAEFEVDSFSSFTVTWEPQTGGAQGDSYSVTVTAYVDGTELDGISNLTFSSENDELDLETLLKDVGYESGDYTFSYATVTVGGTTYGSDTNPVIAIELMEGTGGGPSATGATFTLVYLDGSNESVDTSEVSVYAYYLTPSFSVSIEAVDEDESTEAWALQAVLSHEGSYSSISYEWSVKDTDGSTSQYAKVTNTDNTGRAYISWETGTPDNTEVTVSVSVTLTYEDGTIETATADYVLEYGDETVDLIMTYGPNKTALPAGVEVTVSNGSHRYTGTTDSDGWVHDLEIEPGIYVVTATYTDADGNTYSCSEEVAMHDAGNYSINLNYYDPDILTSVPDRDSWEHIDIKLSVGTSSTSDSGSVSVNITGAQIIGSDGTVKYTATENSIEGNDNEFQLTFYTGTDTSGTPSHALSFDTSDTITITYVLTIDGVEQSPSTITITAATTYDEGTTYPVTGQRAYKLYNYLYGTSYSSDAQLIADGIGDIDISGMSMMLVAAILCDSSEVTGAGQVQAASSQAANQWGMDFALSIEAMNELAASWAFNIEKTYENASMTAGDFVFYLYSASVADDIWTLGTLQSTLTNKTAGMDWDGNSYDTMELFSIAYSDEAIEAGDTYYYILYEDQNSVSSQSGATITFDDTVFGVMVQLGTDSDGEATVTATYYKMTKDGDSYTIDTTYTTGTSVDGKISFDEDDYATFEFTNNYQLYTEISGTKTWEDNDNKYGTRPTSITINLLVNGEQAYDEEGEPISVTVTPDAEGTWSWSFEKLPVYSGVTQFTYSIEEVVVPGYTTTEETDEDGNPTGNLINTLETVELSGEKTWEDSNNAYSTRPSSITIHILADGEEMTSIQVTADDNWAWSLDDLPQYNEEGEEIKYTITEDAVPGYTTDISGYDMTNTLDTVDIEGSKEWVGDSEDNRPASITIHLYADGKEMVDADGNEITTTATSDGNWAWSFTGLPKYSIADDGTTVEIEYTVQEEAIVGGYIPTYVYDEDGNVTITNAIPELQKYVSDPSFGESTDDNLDEDEADNNDTLKYKLEADHIGGAHGLVLHDFLDDQLDISTLAIQSVILYEDADDTGTTLVENEDYTLTTGTCTVDGCNMAGCSFEIHIEDKDVEDLSSDAYVVVIFDIQLVEGVEDFDEETYVDEIDNDLSLSFMAFSVTAWAEPVEVETFSYGFDLYKYDNETNEPLAGVEFVLSKDGDDGTVYAQFEVTDNTYLLSEWVDSEDDATPIVTGSDGKAVVEGLHDGTFNIKETKALEGYEQKMGNITVTITVDADDPFSPTIVATNADVDGEEVKIENTPTDEDTIEIIGSKTWDDGDNADGIRPDSITINLLDDPDSNEPVATQTVTADDNWAWSFKGLPKYDSNGNEINYIITEAEIDGYTYSVDGYDVTNTHEYETRDISGSKTWDDDNDKADARPGSITVNLYQDGELYDSKTVTADDGWAWSWSDLPKNKDGKAIVYTIDEDEVKYYIVSYEKGSFDITNTFVGEEGAEQPPTQGGDQPKTGDTNNLGVWLALLIAALACALVGFRMRRRT